MPLIPGETIEDIQRCIGSKESSLLWVEGPAYGAFDEALHSLALRICSGAEELNLPCVCFFARNRYSFQTEHTSMNLKKAGLIAILYSLISQIVRIVPPSFEPNGSLTEDEFRKLDGTPQSSTAALSIVEALLSVVMPGLIFVVSGFELIDSRENYDPLFAMIRLLKEQPADKRVKVIFLTQGNCRSLVGATDVKERSDASRMAQARGSSMLVGGIAAGEMDLDRY